MVDSRLLRRGLAEHHAGLLPYHKEMVEELFQRGLIKVVFATETLSLGINMPARAVAVSSFTKFDGVNFSNLTTGELTQLMGRAGRRGIDVIGHGVILKESDVEVGTIYEVAMGPTLVVESKFLPSYNMALNLLRVYAPAEAEALMQRSFGQFQKRLAADQTQERLVNVRARLGDIRQMWDDPEVSLDDVGQYFKLEERRRSIRIELKRLRREAGAARHARHGRRGRGQVRSMGGAEKVVQKLEIEAKGLLERQRKLKVVHSPRFGEYLQRYGEIRSLQRELDQGQHELGGQMDEYARKLRRLCRILTETGFLDHDKPTDKGLFASRVYGENTILVAEAVWAGWLEGLASEELCAVLVMLAAEDRNVPRRRDEGGAGRHGPRRYPTHAIAQCARLVRTLYFRFADMEKDLDEPNLRQPSHDFIDFAYRWASTEPLDQIPLPTNVDIGAVPAGEQGGCPDGEGRNQANLLRHKGAGPPCGEPPSPGHVRRKQNTRSHGSAKPSQPCYAGLLVRFFKSSTIRSVTGTSMPAFAALRSSAPPSASISICRPAAWSRCIDVSIVSGALSMNARLAMASIATPSAAATDANSRTSASRSSRRRALTSPMLARS